MTRPSTAAPCPCECHSHMRPYPDMHDNGCPGCQRRASSADAMTCPSCGIPGAPADTCHQCNRTACDACLHNGECALCVDIWREHDDLPPVGRTAA